MPKSEFEDAVQKMMIPEAIGTEFDWSNINWNKLLDVIFKGDGFDCTPGELPQVVSSMLGLSGASEEEVRDAMYRLKERMLDLLHPSGM